MEGRGRRRGELEMGGEEMGGRLKERGEEGRRLRESGEEGD